MTTKQTKPKSVQIGQDQEPRVSGPIMPLRFFYSQDVAPDWSDATDRDSYLREFWKKFGNDMLQSVLATAVAKIITHNWELEGPEKLAIMYHRILRDEADFGRGYSYMIARGVMDYYTQDNGWFIERQRSNAKDHSGPCLGFAHLDSARMMPSGNAEFPYVYMDVGGEYHLMHKSQFIRIVDMPTPETGMYHHQRGFCALSRALSTACILTMIVAMKREKLADLPPSAIAVFNNINRKQFETAINLKSLQDEAAGNVVWRQVLPLFGIDPAHPAAINFISLREVWDGYDDMTQANIAAYSYAAAFRMDPREFWPVSQGPLGTGKEAEVQHQKAKAKSAGLIFTELERAFNHSDSLPNELQFKFAMQDMEEEQQRAQIHNLQVTNIKAMQEAGAQLTPDEVRHLLTIKYKVLPRVMSTVPAEGEAQDLTSSDVTMDDVERQVKAFGGLCFGPLICLDSTGKKEYLNANWRKFDNVPLLAGIKGVAGSGIELRRNDEAIDANCQRTRVGEPKELPGITEYVDPSYYHTLTSAKENAVTSLNAKINSYDRETARRIREDASRLATALAGTHLDNIKDIPDDVWERAVAADMLDDQLEGEKGGAGSGNRGIYHND